MAHPIDPGDPVPSLSPKPASTGDAPLGSAVRVVSLLTIGSRLGGLVRDIVTVRVFGDTWIGSAFAAAFALPNIFRRLFGEGALSAAFIPEYAAMDRDDPGVAARFASRTMRWMAGVTIGVTLVVEVVVLALLLMLPGNPERALSFRLMLVMMPFMPMVCSTAILGAMLQVHGRFAPGAAAPILLNAFIIAAALPFLITGAGDPILTAYLIGVATLVAGAAQVWWTLAALRPFVRWTRDDAGTGEATGRLLKRFVPVLIGLGTIQLNSLFDTVIAMWPIWVGPTMLGMAVPLDEASNGILTYTQRLYQFPLGVFGIAVATAAFPMLSRAAGDPGRFMDTLRRAMRLSLFIGLPASLGLVLVGADLVGVLYGSEGSARGAAEAGGGASGGGGFSADGAARASAVLTGYAVAVWAYSLNHVCTRAFYARGDTRTPMRVAMGAVALNVGLNLALIWPLREAGLAWATGITAVVQCGVLFWILARRDHRDILDRASVVAIARMLGLCVAMGTAVWLTQWVMGNAGGGWWWRAGRLGAGVVVGGGLYLGVAQVVKSAELSWLLEGARRRGPRGQGGTGSSS